ncbi:MAG: hypothetical protein AAGH79_16465 [Bacteroidota bacterium]
MKDNQFEKALRKLFHKDPVVPDTFHWENMDIELPEKKQTRGGFYFWRMSLLLLALFLLVAGVWNWSTSSVDGLYSGEPTASAVRQESSCLEGIVGNDEIQQSSVLPINRKGGSDYTVAKKKISLPRPLHKRSNHNSTESLNSSASPDLQSVSTGSTEDLIAYESATYDLFPISQQQILQPVAVLSFESLQFKASSIPLSDEVLVKEPKVQKDDNRFFLALGYNRFTLNPTENTPLLNKVSTTLGRSFSGGFQISWTSKLRFITQVNYDQFHSVFQHARSLDTIVDAANALRTIRTELTYHNNYSYSLGLKMGLRQSFDVASFGQLYLGGGLEGLYLMEVRGKTTNGLFTEALFVDADTPKTSLGVSVEAGISIPINDRIHFETTYSLRCILLNPVFINYDLYSNYQHTLSLGLSYSIGQF